MGFNIGKGGRLKHLPKTATLADVITRVNHLTPSGGGEGGDPSLDQMVKLAGKMLQTMGKNIGDLSEDAYAGEVLALVNMLLRRRKPHMELGAMPPADVADAIKQLTAALLAKGGHKEVEYGYSDSKRR